MKKFLSLAILAVAGTLAAVAPGPARAQALEEVVQVSVREGWRTSAGTHMAGIEIVLAPGWKTYWRAPGDAGIPPQLDLSGSSNVAGMAMHWPVPEVFWENGLRSIGYGGAVVLPLELTPALAGQEIGLVGQLSIGVCEKICVPVTLDIAARLPVAGGRDGTLAGALAQRPLTGAEAGVASARCRVDPPAEAGASAQLTAEIEMPSAGGTEHVVFEPSDPSIWVAEPVTARSGNTLRAATEIVPRPGDPLAMDRSGLVITILGSERAVEIRGCTGF